MYFMYTIVSADMELGLTFCIVFVSRHHMVYGLQLFLRVSVVARLVCFLNYACFVSAVRP